MTNENFLELIKVKDRVTHMHSINVYKYVKEYCKYYKILDAENVISGSLVHDIGKIFIDDNILKKDAVLTNDEFKQMQQHTLLGYRYLKNNGVPQDIYIYSLYHHHRVDRKNGNYDFSDLVDLEDKNGIEKYQSGINLINICDSFDAMTAKRTYNNPKAIEAALNEICKCKNTQFDAEIADNFIRLYLISKENLA